MRTYSSRARARVDGGRQVDSNPRRIVRQRTEDVAARAQDACSNDDSEFTAIFLRVLVSALIYNPTRLECPEP